MPPPVTVRDVPLLIISTASSSEKRITPSWSIALLKSKLEPVTGIPPSAQKLTLRLPDREDTSTVEADDEETVQIGQWPLVPYAELQVRKGAITLLYSLLFMVGQKMPLCLILLVETCFGVKDSLESWLWSLPGAHW